MSVLAIELRGGLVVVWVDGAAFVLPDVRELEPFLAVEGPAIDLTDEPQLQLGDQR
jgi:hypothetical protein